MPADPVQAPSPGAAAEQVFPPARPQGKSSPTGTPAAAPSQPETDYAELSGAQQAPKQSPPAQYVLAYHIDDQTKQMYFQVLDSQSGQVISQVPPQDVLNDEARITEYLQAQTASANQPAVKGKGD